MAVTKYRITRPYKDDTVWDDFLLALPERNQLASFTKDVPLFVRYLKLVTDKEGRNETFRNFYARCKDGLTVESDVFLSTDELLAIMWKNGYSEQERNAIQFTFPSDYRFHYPEIAALFEVNEEDAYKFCMRSRMDKSHIGELQADKLKRKGLLRDHWLLYAGGFWLCKNYPFFNYAFFLKTWGFSLWFVSMWMLLSRTAHKIWRRNEYVAQQKMAEQVMEGEDAIVSSMRRFANDGKALDYLKGFKSELQATLSEYRQAFASQQAHLITERVIQQLDAVARAEASIGAALQENIVKETVANFRTTFSKDSAMQKAALNYAIDSLANKTGATDPVLAFFGDSVKTAEKVGTAKPDPMGNVAERLSHALFQAENAFQKSFMVSSVEAAEVKGIASKAKVGDGYDFEKLNGKDSARLEELYNSVNLKTGLILPHEKMLVAVPAESEYAALVNKEIVDMQKVVKKERLTAFVNGF